MKKINWLSADELAKKFRIKTTVQPSLNGEVSKGLSTQQKMVFGGTSESAKSDYRKEFQRMLSYVKKNKKELTF